MAESRVFSRKTNVHKSTASVGLSELCFFPFSEFWMSLSGLISLLLGFSWNPGCYSWMPVINSHQPVKRPKDHMTQREEFPPWCGSACGLWPIINSGLCHRWRKGSSPPQQGTPGCTPLIAVVYFPAVDTDVRLFNAWTVESVVSISRTVVAFQTRHLSECSFTCSSDFFSLYFCLRSYRELVVGSIIPCLLFLFVCLFFWWR